MSRYKKAHYNKSDHYYANGKQVLAAAMTPSIRERLDALPLGTEITDEPSVPPVAVTRNCLFGHPRGIRRRFVDLQMVYLCEEDYQNKTIGEIAKELRDAQEKET